MISTEGVWQRQELTIVNTYHAMSLGVNDRKSSPLYSTIKGLRCVYRGAKGCYPRQNTVNDIRNLRKRIKLINLSKSRMKCLCEGISIFVPHDYDICNIVSNMSL